LREAELVRVRVEGIAEWDLQTDDASTENRIPVMRVKV